MGSVHLKPPQRVQECTVQQCTPPQNAVVNIIQLTSVPAQTGRIPRSGDVLASTLAREVLWTLSLVPLSQGDGATRAMSMMPASASSSDDSASSDGSSSEEEGFSFDGRVYPTYQEMVSACWLQDKSRVWHAFLFLPPLHSFSSVVQPIRWPPRGRETAESFRNQLTK